MPGLSDHNGHGFMNSNFGSIRILILSLQWPPYAAHYKLIRFDNSLMSKGFFLKPHYSNSVPLKFSRNPYYLFF